MHAFFSLSFEYIYIYLYGRLAVSSFARYIRRVAQAAGLNNKTRLMMPLFDRGGTGRERLGPDLGGSRDPTR